MTEEECLVYILTSLPRALNAPSDADPLIEVLREAALAGGLSPTAAVPVMASIEVLVQYSCGNLSVEAMEEVLRQYRSRADPEEQKSSPGCRKELLAKLTLLLHMSKDPPSPAPSSPSSPSAHHERVTYSRERLLAIKLSSSDDGDDDSIAFHQFPKEIVQC